MLVNVNRTLLLYLLTAIFIVVILVIVVGTIIAIIKSYKKGEHSKRKGILLTLLWIAIAATSWIFNMGWIRFIMTFMLIPFVHAIVFFLINLFASKYVHKSEKLRKVLVMCCITYLLFYILLPDGGDIGEMYVLFGLIHNRALSNICKLICLFSLLGHIVLLILQITEILKIRKLSAAKENTK